MRPQKVSVSVSGGGSSVWGGITGTLADQTDLQSALDTAATTAVWGGITGTLSSQSDLQTALNLKANLAGPTFTGTALFDTAGSVSIAFPDPFPLATKYLRWGDLVYTAEYGILLFGLSTKADSAAVTAALATKADNGSIAASGLTQASAGLVGGTAAGSVTVMSFAAVTAQLDVATTTTKGLVPSPGTATGRVLDDSLTWVSFPIPVPPDGSVTTAKLATNAVTVDKAALAVRRITALRI